MFLTFLYMITTIMQARTISFLKTQLRTVLRGDKNRSSIMLYTSNYKLLQHTDLSNNKDNITIRDWNGHENEDFTYSHFCLNNETARLGELLWSKKNTKLCTIFPQQQIDISHWLAYPWGKSLFPLYMNNCCQILSTSDSKIHILVEADLETYRPQASTITVKLENYGLITAWTTKNTNIKFILETDIDHIANLIIAIMQGQYYINNGLLATRIQSVSVSGVPYVYDSDYFDEPPPDKNTMQVEWDVYVQKLITLSESVELIPAKDESIENCDPTQDVSLFTHTSDSSKNTENDAADITKHDVETTAASLNTKIMSKETSTVSSARNESDISANESFHTEKRKNNMSSNTNTDISVKNIQQVKSADELVNLKITSTHSGLKTQEKYSKTIKPPNVVIYAESSDARKNVKTLLEKALDRDRYIIYTLSDKVARTNTWTDQVALVVVCGNVGSEIGAQLIEYIIHGGKLLALCSDMLHILLPSFRTAEVRESKLVHFSYGKWKHVRMMHHIFCYHASPVRTRFSQDHEDTRTSALNLPASTNIKDKRGDLYSLDVKILGTEETWHNPSILLATLASSGGKVVFSQIHLEVDPTQYEDAEDIFNTLKESNDVRLEIISDLLNTHLEMEISHISEISVEYTPAYFLGTFEKKLKVIEKLKSRMITDEILTMPNLNIRFYTNDSITQRASPSFLPILTHSCPANFSTVTYFESLITKELGRLVIYTDVLTSTMHVVECRLEHGLTVISRQQTEGQGRSGNIWLNPMGCAMFTLQMHVPNSSYIGSHISILQHYVAVAVVLAVRSKPGYEDIDLRLKWPNDIYAGNSAKIGGLLINTQMEGSLYICNIGVGINLSNSKPTVCINDMIRQYNQKHGTKLQILSYEEFFANVFNSLELLFDVAQSGFGATQFHELYHTYWLHENSNVTVIKRNGESEDVTIFDIDDFGYLMVREKSGKVFSVQPDGNSFDLLKGLIAPK